MRRLLFLVFPLAVFILAGNALADPIELKELYVSPEMDVTVHINPVHPPGLTYNGGAQAGFYVVQIKNLGIFSGFCVDPSLSNNEYSDYELHAIQPGSVYAGAAYMLDKYKGAGVDTAVNVQLAVWDLVIVPVGGSAVAGVGAADPDTGRPGLRTQNTHDNQRNVTCDPHLFSPCKLLATQVRRS